MPWITTGASAASRACRCCRLRRTKRPKWSSCWRTSGTEQKPLPLSLVRVGTGKHLGFVLLAWVLFFMLAAWVLPPLDSHLKPEPLVHWSFNTRHILDSEHSLGCCSLECNRRSLTHAHSVYPLCGN